MAAPVVAISPQARLSYLALYSIRRGFSTSTVKSSSGQFHRSDFHGRGFTSSYETGQPTIGPISEASMYGALRITPKALKQHLDNFVVGQERAKRILSYMVFNHYQRVTELQRRDEEQEDLRAEQEAFREMNRHPVESEYPGQSSTVDLPQSPPRRPKLRYGTSPINDPTPLTIEKSNVMLLGPSGVGKTLMAKTLARVLEVPFSISDCTPFTQAGYIGEDADVCVQRLLAAANYDVAKAERGIICLDEIDKIATAKVSHGKDVSGEGVQQALLKIIEGTTVQVQAKQERGSGSNTGGKSPGTIPGSHPGSSISGGSANPQPPGKGEVYNVRTDNILFICTGAFIGLHKIVMDRIARGSMGFGAPVRAAPASGDTNDPTIKGDDELFRKQLPFFFTPTDPKTSSEPTYNALDLVEPVDLQKYGLIPEFVGRIPSYCALSSLDEEALVRVLTEPRNCLLRQYEQLFHLSGIELRFTSGALREVAKSAVSMGTGARGLRTVMERLLGESMYDAPGSLKKHILITEAVARREEAPIHLLRGQQARFHALIAEEEEKWEAKKRKEAMFDTRTDSADAASSFEEYREKYGLKSSGLG